MQLDIEAMKRVAASLYVHHVNQAYGQPGVDALKVLLEAIHRMYVHVDPGSCKAAIVVFKALQDVDRPISTASKRVINFLSLTTDMKGAVVLQMLDSGEALLWNETEPDCAGLSANAIVYHYRDGAEAIFVKGTRHEVPKIVAGVPSMFALPTFTELRAALEHYRVHVAAQSGCKILQQAWHSSGNRIFWRAKPESFMRDSLYQYLSGCLRGVEVRPEQNVDEDHPVDIKATWVLARRLALIEIKWMGASRDVDDGHITKTWGEARARSGATQMAGYLDTNKQFAATHVTKGWLVVFDARREGLKEDTKTIGENEGRAFRDREIEFDPKYDEVRTDFEKPVRFFMEPVCSP